MTFQPFVGIPSGANVFTLVAPNMDIDVHSNPQGAWARVVVLGGWQDAKITRKRWPDAAVVGPLRTMSGIDLLVRNLLANPQVRVIVWDGPAPGIGKAVKEALFALWNHKTVEPCRALNEELHAEGMRPGPNGYTYGPAAQAFDEYLFEEVALVSKDEWEAWMTCDGTCPDNRNLDIPTEDRSGGRHVLPPPAPKVETDAPHGDPGDRVVGETLGDVWPLVLDRAMRFGRTVPTQYGPTREVLNLTSVIRDVQKSLDEFRAEIRWEDVRKTATGVHGVFIMPSKTVVEMLPHPVLGLTWDNVQEYAQQWLTKVEPEGVAYTYGSRMHGEMAANLRRDLEEAQRNHTRINFRANYNPDQITNAIKMLTDSPSSRALYLTPWRPDEDSGKESGRPCLVGVWLRATPGRYRVYRLDPNDAFGEPLEVLGEVDAWDITKSTHGFEGPVGADPIYEPTLHMTIAFRSHDLFGAYGQNLAAACLLLEKFAKASGMAMGTITCHSYSAHVYDRHWNEAQEIAKKHPGPVIRWDPRSQWRVEVFEIDTGVSTCARCREYAQWKATNYEPTDRDFAMLDNHNHPTTSAAPTKKTPKLRAVAHEPGDAGRVIATFEGPTIGAVALQISRSGLAQEPGNLLWLGGELVRVASKAGIGA